ncbi:hypothetical protein ACOQFV_16045 [Nocardiopsis changdeensis]|uniref:Uncharacterized protein n=1 Tax=Nocardiopsis changdeensis TaxID=2831969 RepID=A0ABX8BH43_9ACTN|nr:MULTISPECIES: hypothetical protein [Nocardiopsis]QUX21541.1 hypothetical protein KGD84_24520 [Nocardiopsis changdeensis]QYX37474.1 hypothetical protein K1J57_01890 [Nocardiopsis sp. MT53]
MDPIVIGGLAGAVGSVVTALTTQVFAHRTKARELEHAERVSLQQARSDEEKLRDEQRRSGYVALNSEAREFLAALTDLLKAVESDDPRDEERAALDRARASYRHCYAEAQLALNDEILEVASGVNRSLLDLFGLIKRIDKGRGRPGETCESAEAKRQEVWGRIGRLRSVMRSDLGISTSQR